MVHVYIQIPSLFTRRKKRPPALFTFDLLKCKFIQYRKNMEIYFACQHKLKWKILVCFSMKLGRFEVFPRIEYRHGCLRFFHRSPNAA